MPYTEDPNLQIQLSNLQAALETHARTHMIHMVPLEPQDEKVSRPLQSELEIVAKQRASFRVIATPRQCDVPTAVQRWLYRELTVEVLELLKVEDPETFKADAQPLVLSLLYLLHDIMHT